MLNSLQLPELTPVGIGLGNSLYGLHAQSCGRIFKGYIRNISGEILGKLEKNENAEIPVSIVQQCMQLAWKIIAYMHGDGCLWVDEKTAWGRQPLLEVLTAPQPVQVEHLYQPAHTAAYSAAH